jgi:hypothetical protein
VNPNPFDALGLPTRRDLTDEQVRAAWHKVAAATHPDRGDGGDPARFAAASAAYAEIRTPWARSEAFADHAGLACDGDDEPDTSPLPPVPGETLYRPVQPWQPLIALRQVPARIRRGRPLRLLIRAVIAAALCLAVLALIPGTPAAPADVGGVILWFVLTGRRDLAPPPERLEAGPGGCTLEGVRALPPRRPNRGVRHVRAVHQSGATSRGPRPGRVEEPPP